MIKSTQFRSKSRQVVLHPAVLDHLRLLNLKIAVLAKAAIVDDLKVKQPAEVEAQYDLIEVVLIKSQDQLKWLHKWYYPELSTSNLFL